MKKILATLLALCLALTLTVSVFADGSRTDPSRVEPARPGTSSGNGASGTTVSKDTYSAVDANGAPVVATVGLETAGPVYEEVAGYGVIGLYNISILSATNGIVTVDVYAPGVTSDCVVIVRDEWELLEGANLKVNGDRASFSFPADLANTYHYFAIVKGFESVSVDTAKEDTDQAPDEEQVDVGDTDTEEPAETTPAPAEQNPPTGLALAVVPMIVAAAAVVVSKRR